MLRFESPVLMSGSTPLEDRTIAGTEVAAGQSVTPILAAANRDPAAYPDPERFDITRENTDHHSFGGGVHYCLGAPLARAEAQIAVGTLVTSLPGDAAVRSHRWSGGECPASGVYRSCRCGSTNGEEGNHATARRSAKCDPKTTTCCKRSLTHRFRQTASRSRTS